MGIIEMHVQLFRDNHMLEKKARPLVFPCDLCPFKLPEYPLKTLVMSAN